MIESINNYCLELTKQFDTIPETRKAILIKLSDYIKSKKIENKPIKLVYICTHNSRRSHLGQVWAHVAASYYQIHNVTSYSGGTEATAFNPNAISALKRIGFEVQKITEDKNPIYEVYHDINEKPSICYSKTYDDEKNPQTEFVAIMTCSDAEENCPFIPGVELRIGTTYEDPKAFDNTPEQDAKYDERCKQIALETLFIFSKLN
jgi:arsenate reductase